MHIKHLLVLAAAFALISCDAAMEQVDGQLRVAVVAQCQQVSENLGIAPEFTQPVCDCSADKLLEGGAAQLTEIDQARVEEIVRSCASETNSPATEPVPEQANG
jgi:hypothetical protein